MDIGEGFPYDEQLLEFATSANVCCGEHAGSWELTLETIEMCKRKGTRIGMHPGFPDRASMGRAIPAELTPDFVASWLKDLERQRQGFISVCDLAYVKPHGGWYNVLSAPYEQHGTLFLHCHGALLASGFPKPLTYMLLGGSALATDWSSGPQRETSARLLTEGFADRAYQPDGTLVPRTEAGAVLEDPDEIKAQVLRLAPEVDSICLHGDTPGCLEFAEMVRKTLEDAGYEVAA